MVAYQWPDAGGEILVFKKSKYLEFSAKKIFAPSSMYARAKCSGASSMEFFSNAHWPKRRCKKGLATPPGHCIAYRSASSADSKYPAKKQASAIAASIQVLASHSFFGSGISFQASLYFEIAPVQSLTSASASPDADSAAICSCTSVGSSNSISGFRRLNFRTCRAAASGRIQPQAEASATTTRDTASKIHKYSPGVTLAAGDHRPFMASRT